MVFFKKHFCLLRGDFSYNKTVKHDFMDYIMFYEIISATEDIGGVLK